MMGKLILYQNRERAIVAVHQYHMGPCDYGPQLRANYEKSNVYVHDTTLRPQNAEQLRENGWLRCTVGVNHNHLKHMIARSAIPLQRHKCFPSSTA